jgi:DNA (cytosine-5)-methyltransferase 1
MGLPDDWTDVPFEGNPAPDWLRFRAIGNAMAVPCVRWIGERIEQDRLQHKKR